MNKVYVAAYRRTPFVKFAGVFQNLSAVQLGSIAAKSAMSEVGLDPTQIDYVVVGQVLQALSGQNPSRQTAVAAGVAWKVPSTTINAVCLSGMEAISHAARLISCGERDVVLAVGQESMSQAPHASTLRAGSKYGAIQFIDTVEFDGLTDAYTNRSMGWLTDQENARLNITREQQDWWAARSHQLAENHASFLSGEIVPVQTGKGGLVEADNGIRSGTTIESLETLKPAFSESGTITAGNASQITDGAAALVLVSEKAAKELGITVLAEVLAFAQVAGPDATLQAQPSNAILAALHKAGVGTQELAHVEINEAFAAVVAQSVKELNISEAIVNPHSGAIALGHPIGASGARIVGHLARGLKKLGSGKLGAAGICGGGGQGSAVILRSV